MAVTDMSLLREKHSAELALLGGEVLEAKADATRDCSDLVSVMVSEEKAFKDVLHKENREIGITIKSIEILQTDMIVLAGLVLELKVNAFCLLFYCIALND